MTRVYAEPPDPEKIQLTEGELPQQVDRVADVLADPACGVYCRGGQLVRPASFVDARHTFKRRCAAGVERPDMSIILAPVNALALAEVLSRRAGFERYDGRAKRWVAKDCPPELAQTFLARRGAGWDVPPLRGIVSAPTIRPDETLLSQQGYDVASGLYFASGGYAWPEIKEKPSIADAQAGIRHLKAFLVTMPFVTAADCSAAIAFIMTALVRPSLDTAPIFAISAPEKGTGKTLLAHAVSVLALGHKAPAIGSVRDDIELEKRLAGALLDGDQFLLIDNVTHTIGSDLLCTAVTSPQVKIRPLGQSEGVTIDNAATFCMTGNNLAVAADLVRRTVMIQLDAQCSNPEDRPFETDLTTTAIERRGQLVKSALEVMLAFLHAKGPEVTTGAGGFEDWSALVRSALIWAGEPDPMSNSKLLRADDPEMEEEEELLTALHEHMVRNQRRTFTSKDVEQIALDSAELRAALSRFYGRDLKFDRFRFGNRLKRLQGRVRSGLILKRARESTKAALWTVVHASPSGA